MKAVKSKLLFVCTIVLLFGAVPVAQGLVVGNNIDIHMDIPGVIANDFHVEGRLESGDWNGNWSNPPKLVFHVDDRFPHFKYSIDPDPAGPGQNWYKFTADWSGADYKYCDVLHLGLFFDVTCHNVAVDLVGWWTVNGEPIPPGGPIPPPNGGAVPIPGFEVLDTPLQGPQKVTMHNDSHLFDGPPGGTSPGIEVEIVALSLVSVDPIQLEEHLGPLPEALRELRRGGLEETLPWVEVANQNGPISETNPQHFPADSFFDIFFEVDVSRGLFPVEPVTVQPGGFVIVRERLRFINNAGEPDWRWAWEIHQAHEADLGDAPDSTNSWPPATMTAYPAGGPPGVVANYPTVYRMGSPPHGPIHWAPHAVGYLGPQVSLEFEADIWADQDGINNLEPPPDVPDQDGFDDGVQVPLSLPHCQQTQFTYDVTITPMLINPPDLYVNVWFDWTRNGDWDDTPQCPDGTTAPEWAVRNQVISGYAPGMHTITTPLFTCWHPPAGVDPNPNPIWMRITISEQRWSSTGGTAGYGGAGPAPGYLYGETEDYYFEPIPQAHEWDFGDAPEAALAYPSTCKIGAFPTCMSVGPAMWIRHASSGRLFFGPMLDLEADGNAGLCASLPCFPPYDQDECFKDGDAGLVIPPAYTIVGPVGSEKVVPCMASDTGSLGMVCSTALWGKDVDIHVTNQTLEDVYVNVLMDWNKSGEWSGSSMCPPCLGGAIAPEHVLVDFPVPPHFSGRLSTLMPVARTFTIGPNPGYIWTRFTVTPNRMGGGWPGDGEFSDGETEDYLLHVKPAPVSNECDWNVGDEHKMHHAQLPDLDQTGVDVDMFWTPLADDFKCAESGYITDIHFWGSFADDCLPAGGPASLTFHVTIYSDIPAADSSTGYSMPGEPMWDRVFEPCTYTVRRMPDGPEDWYDPVTKLYSPQNHFQAYQYNICIDDDNAFHQEEGKIYWLEIKDIMDAGFEADYTFGWKTTQIDLHWNDDAVYQSPDGSGWAELKYPPEHPYAEHTMDLAFVITGQGDPEPDIDWGDAPDPTYPTLAASLGASHVIVPNIFMGNMIDRDPDGQPTPLADGDDNDPDGDDEDGVTFDTPLIPGQMAQITVNAFIGGPFISVWIDFDGDGGWGQAHDYVVKSVLANGGPNVFQIPVPAGIAAGIQTFARIRFTTNPGIGFGGPATNGEVEDYLVDIEPGYEPKPPVPHLKWSQPPLEIDPVVGRMPTYCGWDQLSFSTKELGTEPAVWRVAADDFRCLGRMPITSVHWWGSYKNWLEHDPPAGIQPNSWRIAFWSNAPIDALHPYSRPEKLLHVIKVHPSEVEEVWVGMDMFPDPTIAPEACFQYYVQLKPKDYFWQHRFLEHEDDGTVRDTVFWISITAVYEGFPGPEHPWGWKTRPEHWMDDAVTFSLSQDDFEIGQVLDPDGITPLESNVVCDRNESYDLAFELDTEPNYIKWEQPFTGLRHWKHYEDEESMGIEKEATPTKCEQLPDLYWPGLHCHDTLTYQITLADDWVCEGGPVTDLHWYGNYEVDDQDQEMRGRGINLFHLSIHRIASHACIPGDAVWSTDVPFASVSETDTGLTNSEGSKIYLYEYDLPNPYPQIEGNKYWLDISAKSAYPDSPAIWRWQEAGRSPTPIECGAAERNDPMPGVWRTIIWPPVPPDNENRYSDMAFAITNGPKEKVVEIQRLVADDWPCTTKEPIVAAVWWGSYLGYHYEACECPTAMRPVKPAYFLLSIWTDVPAGVDLPHSHPGEKIWEYKAYEHEYDEVLVGFDKHPEDVPGQQDFAREPVFRYSVRLPKENWFGQKEEDAVYWFSVVAVYKEQPDGTEPPYRWGWTNHEHVFNDDAVAGTLDPTGVADKWIWTELLDQTEEASVDMSFILFTEPGCFPSSYSTYLDWIAVGKPNCWCGIYGTPQWPYQCYGDAANNMHPRGYIVYATDLAALSNSWKAKIGDPNLNPCADFDHKQHPRGYRVYAGDLNRLSTNWKKKSIVVDPVNGLPANCPIPE